MTIVTEKRCTKCGRIKSIQSYYFSKTRNQYIAQCIECSKLAHRNLSTKARERKNARNRERYWEDPEKSREKSREQARKCVQKNRDAYNARQRENRKADPERYREYSRKHHRENKEKRAEIHNNWLSRNPDKNREYKANRRAKKLKAGGKFTAQEFKELCDKYNNRCLCCGSKENITADHVIPISLGGRNDISNIQPLCFTCNARKHAKHIDYRS